MGLQDRGFLRICDNYKLAALRLSEAFAVACCLRCGSKDTRPFFAVSTHLTNYFLAQN